MARMFNPLSRRSLLAGTAATMTLGVAACGGSSQKDRAAEQGSSDLEARGTSGDLKDLMANNPQSVDKLEDGGSFTLTVGNLGPNYNSWSNGGNSVDVSTIQAACDVAGVWNAKADGTPVLNKNFCTDATYDDSGDKPVITYTLNPDATWNDGTAYDWKTFENQWKMMSGQDKTVDAVSTEGYERIEKVEAGDDEKQVVVTMKEPYQPWQDLFDGTFHPGVNTAKIFNDGFVEDTHPEWQAGPFQLKKLDSVQKRVVLEPNDKWWGEKTVLDSVVYVQMEDSKTIPAFRNGEIDGTGISNINRYKEAQGIKDMEVRRSQALSVAGLNFNTRKGVLKDIDVRKAIYQGIDRAALAKLRFNGLNWTEELPGSWMLMPFSPNYQDSYPVEHDMDAAKKTLEDAGWKAGDGKVREKGGKPLEISITTFGDDPVTNALVQNMQKNLQKLGFDCSIDAKGSGDFGKVMGEQSFQLIFMSYTIGSDPTGVVKQFFSSRATSNMTGTGSKEIDALIPKVSQPPELEERSKLANEAEKKFQELYAMMPLWNGPSIIAYKKGLANYGPSLFETKNWSTVGWEKGTKD